jgi:hypothetical protein
MKSQWNGLGKLDIILWSSILTVFLALAIVLYKEPFFPLFFLLIALFIWNRYRNKYLYVEINEEEVILKKLFKTTHLHRLEIEAYSEWNMRYDKNTSFKELLLHTNSKTYTIVGGAFKNYDKIRANLINRKLENRTQESIEKANQKARWTSIIPFILTAIFSYVAYIENNKSIIEEKDVKTIKGELNFSPELKSRKKNKSQREKYVILQVKDCNRFFHIEEPLLDELPKNPPPPQKDENSATTSHLPIDYGLYSYLKIKDSVEIRYIDRHTSKDLKAQVYGLKHNQTTYFWKNWTEIKAIINSNNNTLLFLILALAALLFGISIALGYTSKWFTGISV